MIKLRYKKPELLKTFLTELLSGVMLVFSSYCGESRLCARFDKLVEYALKCLKDSLVSVFDLLGLVIRDVFDHLAFQ